MTRLASLLLCCGALAACDHIPFLSDDGPAPEPEPPIATLLVHGPLEELVLSDSLWEDGPLLVVNAGYFEYLFRPAVSLPLPPFRTGAVFKRWPIQNGNILSEATVFPDRANQWVEATPAVLTPDGRYALVTIIHDLLLIDVSIRMYDVTTGAIVQEFPVDSSHYLVGVGQRDDAYLAITSSTDLPTNYLKRWAMDTGDLLDSLELPRNEPATHPFYPQQTSPDGDFIALFGRFSADFRSGNTLRDRWSHSVGAFSRDGNYVAGWYPEGDVGVTALTSGFEIRRFAAENVTAVALSKDGSVVAAAGWEYMIAVWDVDSGARIRTIHTDKAATHLVLSPDGRYVVAGCEISQIRVWEVKPIH